MEIKVEWGTWRIAVLHRVEPNRLLMWQVRVEREII